MQESLQWIWWTRACGIIISVKLSARAALFIPVIMKDGSVRHCDDHKVTVNSVTRMKYIPCQELKSTLLLWLVVTSFPSWAYPIHIFNYNWTKCHKSMLPSIYSFWTLWLHKTAFWCHFSSCHLPAHHGGATQRFTNGCCLYWRYPGN